LPSSLTFLLSFLLLEKNDDLPPEDCLAFESAADMIGKLRVVVSIASVCLVSLALDRECAAPSSPNSLKYSSLSQNQVLLIMPHGQLATAVESQIECTEVVL
jgi:hypothetical protein